LNILEQLHGAALFKLDVEYHDLGVPVPEQRLGMGYAGATAHFESSSAQGVDECERKLGFIFDHQKPVYGPECRVL
jgi:hypothetical protein